MFDIVTIFYTLLVIAAFYVLCAAAHADPTNGDTIQSNATATVQSYVDCTLNGCTEPAETVVTDDEVVFVYREGRE